MDEMEDSKHCTCLNNIIGERYKQKIRTYVVHDPYVMMKSDFSTAFKYLPV